MLNNVKNLPQLSEEYSLSAAQISRFQQDGHLVATGILSAAEVAAYRPFLAEEAARQREKLSPRERAVGASSTKFIFDLRTTNNGVRRFVTARRFGKLAADLLGVASVRILHYNCFFKPPGGYGTPWHQDHLFMPLACEQVITLWLPLVDLAADMGLLTFASESHQAGFVDLAGSGQIERAIVDRGYSLTTTGPMAAGDVSFHASWTLHRADANTGGRMREVIAMSYYPDGTSIADPQNASFLSPQMLQSIQYREHFLDHYFSGLAPGDPAAGPANPVVY